MRTMQTSNALASWHFDFQLTKDVVTPEECDVFVRARRFNSYGTVFGSCTVVQLLRIHGTPKGVPGFVLIVAIYTHRTPPE